MARYCNCVSAPGGEAHIAIEDGGTEREITMPLCEEYYEGFDDTVGVTVSRTQPAGERRNT
jgi:hypothetical protein